MITEDYINFELAKLLKEKGFDEECQQYYGDYKYLCPTLQMTMKWLRKVHNIDIDIHAEVGMLGIKVYIPMVSTYKTSETDSEKLKQYKRGIYHKDNNGIMPALQYYHTYEEACEAAIKYCLENLIKNEDEEEKSNIPVPKTVDEAVETLGKIVSKEDRDYLLENGAISMHNSLGRWIRNEWGLWTGSELKDELMNMNKGLNHPDDMSNYIIEEFIKYWNNKL